MLAKRCDERSSACDEALRCGWRLAVMAGSQSLDGGWAVAMNLPLSDCLLCLSVWSVTRLCIATLVGAKCLIIVMGC
jgi:hypothetical protein